jgi:hypothetical protein
MNELPPVRKTRSISSTDTLSRRSRWFEGLLDPSDVVSNPALKILTGDLLFDMELAAADRVEWVRRALEDA